MLLKPWNDLPDFMKTEEVRPYYDMLKKHTVSLILKRTFDFTVSLILMLIIWPILLIIALAVKLDSPGPAFYKQERVTMYGKRFKIWKFRTMVVNADKIGTQSLSATTKGLQKWVVSCGASGLMNCPRLSISLRVI